MEAILSGAAPPKKILDPPQITCYETRSLTVQTIVIGFWSKGARNQDMNMILQNTVGGVHSRFKKREIVTSKTFYR